MSLATSIGQRFRRLGRVPVVTAVLVALAIGSAAPAATVNFQSPSQWTRGSAPFSTFQQWDVFPTTAGPNTPNSPNQIVTVNGNNVLASVAANPFNAYGTANVHEVSGASLLTSGGNIYSPFAVIDLDADIPTYASGNPGGWTTIILQTRTLATVLSPSSINIVSNSQTFTPVDSAQLFFEQVSSPFGLSTIEECWFEFHLPGSAASYTLNFAASASSMSLDNVAVDTIWTAAASPIDLPNPVPEPASILLAVLGGIGLWIARKRSRPLGVRMP